MSILLLCIHLLYLLQYKHFPLLNIQKGTQVNHQIHREVNDQINISTSLVETEAALSDAMETTATSNNNN